MGPKLNDADQTLVAHERCIPFASHRVVIILFSAGKDGNAIVWDTETWNNRLELDDRSSEISVCRSLSRRHSVGRWAGTMAVWSSTA